MLRERTMITERSKLDSAQLASVGSALLRERSDKPKLKAMVAGLKVKMQAQLFAEMKVNLVPDQEPTTPGREHGKLAANCGQRGRQQVKGREGRLNPAHAGVRNPDGVHGLLTAKRHAVQSNKT